MSKRIKAVSLMTAILLSTNAYSAVDELVGYFYGAVGGYSVKCENFRDGAMVKYGKDLEGMGLSPGSYFDEPSFNEGWLAVNEMSCKQTREGLIETGLYRKFF